MGDLVRTIIVDSTVTCRMKRSDVISNDRIKAGDVIVGLSSYGQASYETEYNGGMGSNGLTSARHDVFAKYLAKKYPESYDNSVPEELVYSGKCKLTDEIAGLGIDAGKLVLSPTRTYIRYGTLLRWGPNQSDEFRGEHAHREGQYVPCSSPVQINSGTIGNPVGRNVQGIQHGSPYGNLRGRRDCR